MRDYAVAIVRERYTDFGPALAAEKLAEHDGLTMSRETLRKWMAAAGLWLSRQQRRTFHQPRLRREAYGELVQIDGSEHRWFEDRGDTTADIIDSSVVSAHHCAVGAECALVGEFPARPVCAWPQVPHLQCCRRRRVSA
ncbi:hypothetical protein ABIA27_001249 [Sinorhizobium fredii]